MKIAFLNIYNGKVERGSEVFVSRMAVELGKDHQVSVFQTGEKTDTHYSTVTIGGVPFQQQSPFYPLWVFLFTLKCIPQLWKEKYDWIVPVNGYIQVLLMRLLRNLRGGKLLISGHAGIGRDDAFNIIVGNPDVFVALTTNALDWAKKFGMRRKIVHIPNGVDTRLFNPEEHAVLLSVPNPIILCVSALLPYKRIELLIEAVSRIPQTSLQLIGDGPLYNKLHALGIDKLGEKFSIIRRVDHQHMPGYYRAATVFSLPSKSSEAFGLVYVEALSCNIPLVAPDDQNRRMIIGEGGLFCNVENIDEYTATLKKALSKSFGNKPRKQAEKFSWEIIAKNYEKVFLSN